MESVYIVCPFCGLNRKYLKSGIDSKKELHTKKGTAHLSVVDPENGVFIDHRDTTGGYKSGFPRLSTESLREVRNMSEYKDLIESLKKQCYRVLAVLED